VKDCWVSPYPCTTLGRQLMSCSEALSRTSHADGYERAALVFSRAQNAHRETRVNSILRINMKRAYNAAGSFTNILWVVHHRHCLLRHRRRRPRPRFPSSRPSTPHSGWCLCSMLSLYWPQPHTQTMHNVKSSTSKPPGSRSSPLHQNVRIRHDLIWTLQLITILFG
jgi:hypothetical protein